MFLSDLAIGFDSIPVTLPVYGSFLVTVVLGQWLRGQPSPWRILGASLAGSILFYLVTNAAVWWFSGLYPQTFAGLVLSYFYALPFFRHTLLGDLAYTLTFFLAYQYAPRVAPVMARRKHTQSQEAYL